MTDPNPTSRNLWRSTGAILAGFFAVFALSLATDQVFHALAIYPPWGEPMTATAPLLLALSYRIIYGIAGGYLVAALAPHHPLGHALIMGGVGFVLSIAGGIAMWDMGAHWYPIVLALTAIPCAWAGAALQLNHGSGHDHSAHPAT